MCSDHFAPWSARQGESGFAWAWLGSALATTNLSFGLVNAPGQRYHPAIVAQAFATLAEMFPGRFWAALGSGEAMNEHITGDAWPPKEHRNERLRECVDIMRRLFAGQEVTHHGRVTVDRARLWSLPQEPPPLVAAATSVPTARWVAEWGDGMVVHNQGMEHLRRVVDAYRDAGGRGKVYLQVHLSWAPTQEEAEAVAHDQWRSNVFPPPACWDIDSPEIFDAVSADVPLSTVAEAVRVSSDLKQHAAWLHEYLELGFDGLYLHHVGQSQAAFLDAFGAHVLPELVG
jgi:probable non-F420 flavinoid oxidoreductase